MMEVNLISILLLPNRTLAGGRPSPSGKQHPGISCSRESNRPGTNRPEPSDKAKFVELGDWVRREPRICQRCCRLGGIQARARAGSRVLELAGGYGRLTRPGMLGERKTPVLERHLATITRQ